MTIQKKIEEALSRSVCGGWDRGFLESILQQIEKGRDFSVKQKQTLGNVLARNTPEDQIKHENWSTIYEKEYQANARVLAAYHMCQPYYKPMAQDILNGNVPERSKFLRMYDNKYSKKVLGQHGAPPKFELGSYLMPRSAFDSYKNVDWPSDMVWANQNRIVQNFKKRGGFVIEIREEIMSHAKGAKRYKLLPIGETSPIIVEERFLKAAPKQKQGDPHAIYSVLDAPKYKIGDFVRCGYDLMDFYTYIYENDEDDYLYFRFYGIVVDVAWEETWLFYETVYKVYCIDGLYRFFLEDEVALV